MNRIEITNKINQQIARFNNWIVAHWQKLIGEKKSVSQPTYNFQFVQLRNFSTSQLSNLIAPEYFPASDKVYLHPYSPEIADFCSEYVKKLNLAIAIIYYEKHNYVHLNLQYSKSIDIQKVIESLQMALFKHFGR